MRDLILGVFLGVLLTVLPDWMEKHNMDNYVDVAMIIVIVGIFLLIIWRPILKLIAKYNPELWLTINEIFAPAKYDDAMQKAITKRKTKREAKQHERNNKSSDDTTK